MKTARLITTLLATLLLATSAWALELQQAKDSGWIGEMSTGYVGLVTRDAPADAAALVRDVNSRRRQIYASQAQKNGIALAEVEKIAAERNIERTESGHYVNVDGRWRRKP